MGPTRTTFAIVVAAVALSACGESTPNLMNLRKQSSAPDEFSILPSTRLSQPESYTDLPTPTPGGSNRTDRNPKAEAVAALGGNANAGSGGDAGLIGTTTRYGVAPDIRTTLAAEDLEFRRQNDGRFLERLMNVNVYFKAYREQSLDRYAELRRLRRAGVRTPAAPPKDLEQ